MRVWVALGVLVGLILAVNFASSILAERNCPEKTYGTGEKHIKYFSSPLCMACWVEKPIVKHLAEDSNVTFEEYNVDFCRDSAAPYYIRGVPAFLIGDKIIYGFQSEDALEEMIE